MKLIVTLLLFPVLSFGQITFKGLIKDKKNNAPIPYATVGLMNENTGTTADENGLFELKSLKSFADDTLIVTCLGYQVSKIKVSNLDTSNIEILLIEKSFNLKEIVITNKNKSKKDILNNFDTSSYCYEGTGSPSLNITQIAQHFQIQHTNGQLTKVKICDGSVMLGKKIAKYRLRIYAMDPITKGPSSDLCSQVIEVKTKLKRSGIYSINLEKYKIMIPDNDFFIAVEWLNIPYNYYKKKEEKDGWCLPTIGWKSMTELTLESWVLDYKNKWRSRQQTMLIAATVKY